VTDAAPGRVLRLAMLGWGLGDLAMGRRAAGVAWLVAEALSLAAVVTATVLFADTTWYLLPFLAGMAFIAVWTAQAIGAYQRARAGNGATPPASASSPAAAIAWLAIPLLAWGTGFWLFAAEAATPGAVLDRFVSAWSESAAHGWDRPLSEQPAELSAAAEEGRALLRDLCAAGRLSDDCDGTNDNPLSDVRLRITTQTADTAIAVAEVVRFERRPSRVLGLFDATELVPVPIEPILHLQLAARPSWLGAARWTIVSAEPG
jgi:hypothetical protein